MQRLKDADEATRRMTRDEYVHYSECRQASFTFRKAKKFREFINSNAYLDVKPNDDIIDILGFLAFEVVRELCLGAVAIKKALEEQQAARLRAEVQPPQKRKLERNAAASATKRPKSESGATAASDAEDSATAADRTVTATTDADADADTAESTAAAAADDELCTLFSVPPSVETPLLASHIHEAFARLQRKHPAALSTGLRGSSGPGGLRRTRVFVI